jgi:hypothetical protein
MTELARVHRLTRVSLKKRRAEASFKAIKLKLRFGIDGRSALPADSAGC